MSGSTLGTLFTVTTFGESHGPAIGCVVDGCPPGMALSVEDIQPDLDRRKPGTSRHVTQRREDDVVEILSGVYEGKTTGTPIALLIRNTDARSKDYTKIANSFRPGHADYTYLRKYGIRDPRGGGRSSARLTAPAVAAGAIAKKWLRERHGVEVRGYLSQLGPNRIDFKSWDDVHAEGNAFFVADRWDYSNQLGPWQYRYWSLDRNAQGGWDAPGFWLGIAFATLLAGLSAWWGLARGRWMRGVMR